MSFIIRKIHEKSVTLYKVIKKNYFKLKVSLVIKNIIKKYRVFNKIIKDRFRFSKQQRSWFKANGDKTFRLKYDLNTESLVFDIGGYGGEWAGDIFSKYSCRIYIFEPVSKFVQNIKKRFDKNQKIVTYNFGLGDKTEHAKININQNSSSLFRTTSKIFQKVKIIRAIDFLNENNISKVDLMKINIEGGEYDLLEDLIQSGQIKKIKNIQIQFHDFIPHAKTRRNNIQIELGKTHEVTYQFPFVWENWQIKQSVLKHE